MGRNLAKDAVEMAEKRKKLLNAGFHLFTEKGIEQVSLNEVAAEAGVGVATLYRYYSSKQDLVLEIGTTIWSEYTAKNMERNDIENPSGTAVQRFESYLESFIDLYRNHKDLLRFNQLFNIYVINEQISIEKLEPYNDMIRLLEQRFCKVYQKAEQDGTLRTDIPEQEMFSTVLHLMLAVVTRYAVGLVYNDGTDPEKELLLQKKMLMNDFSTVSRSSGFLKKL